MSPDSASYIGRLHYSSGQQNFQILHLHFVDNEILFSKQYSRFSFRSLLLSENYTTIWFDIGSISEYDFEDLQRITHDNQIETKKHSYKAFYAFAIGLP